MNYREAEVEAGPLVTVVFQARDDGHFDWDGAATDERCGLILIRDIFGDITDRIC